LINFSAFICRTIREIKTKISNNSI